jgi:hypothetical protein
MAATRYEDGDAGAHRSMTKLDVQIVGHLVSMERPARSAPCVDQPP